MRLVPHVSAAFDEALQELRDALRGKGLGDWLSADEAEKQVAERFEFS